jgi:hypothetical protein
MPAAPAACVQCQRTQAVGAGHTPKRACLQFQAGARRVLRAHWPLAETCVVRCREVVVLSTASMSFHHWCGEHTASARTLEERCWTTGCTQTHCASTHLRYRFAHSVSNDAGMVVPPFARRYALAIHSLRIRSLAIYSAGFARSTSLAVPVRALLVVKERQVSSGRDPSRAAAVCASLLTPPRVPRGGSRPSALCVAAHLNLLRVQPLSRGAIYCTAIMNRYVACSP